jgi:hypothetical protein
MAGRLISNLIAFKILYMLVTPFEKTEAYKRGIIDKDGNALKKTRDLKTEDEKDSYTQLDKLVFSLKRILAKLPGGDNRLKSIVAAYWLIKESYTTGRKISQAELKETIDLLENSNITLVEEEILIEKFMKVYEDGSIANVTGAATATDQAAVKINKKGKPISGIVGVPNYMARRKGINNENV